MRHVVVVLAAILNSCTLAIDDPSTIEPVTEVRPEFGTQAPDCRRFYNNGHHREWADCMGVPYR